MAQTAATRWTNPGAAVAMPRDERFPGVPTIVLGAILAMLLLLGAGGAMLFGVAQAHAVPPAPALTSAMGPLAPLPAMEFTLAGERRLHTVNLQVTLEFEPGTDPEAAAQSVSRVAMAVSGRMIELQPGELAGAAGTSLVKQQVGLAANRELKPMRVRSVMLQQFLIR